MNRAQEDYSVLLRWAIKNYFSGFEEIELPDKRKIYVYENVYFTFPSKGRSRLDAYAFKGDITRNSVLGDEALLVYTNKTWVYEGAWKRFVDGLFYRIEESKISMDEELERQKRKDREEKEKKLQEKIDSLLGVFDGLVKPAIELMGENPTYLHAGFPYSERGYYATDVYGKNITSEVVITGSVDEKEVGEHFITYTVTDDYGAENSVKRTVIVR